MSRCSAAASAANRSRITWWRPRCSRKPPGKPVKVVWTREDDIRFDYFHSVAAMHMKGGLDASGKLQSWLFRSAFPPIASTFAAGAEYGADFETGMALNEMLFDVPHIRAENCPAKNHVRQGWLRAVCHLFHAFAIHSFVDELAHLNKTQLRRLLPQDHRPGPPRRSHERRHRSPGTTGNPPTTFPLDTGRLRRVLEQCADKIGLCKFTNSKNRAIGIAAHRSFLSYVATAVEIAIDGKGESHHPECVDGGRCRAGRDAGPRARAVRRRGGLRHLARHDGRDHRRCRHASSNRNFHNYPVARMKEAPRKIDVTIVDSKEPHAGAGEPGAPVIAPAITAAIFAATGKRIRELPIKRTKLV